MGFDTADFIRHFEAGESIPLESQEHLVLVEDALVRHYLSGENLQLRRREIAELDWSHRVPLVQALASKAFTGTFTDITVEPMNHPLEELLQHSKRYTHQKAADVVGFVVRAALQSSGAGNLGNLERPVWIRKTPTTRHRLWAREIGPDRGSNVAQEAQRASKARGKLFSGPDEGGQRRTAHKRVLSDGSNREFHF